MIDKKDIDKYFVKSAAAIKKTLLKALIIKKLEKEIELNKIQIL